MNDAEQKKAKALILEYKRDCWLFKRAWLTEDDQIEIQSQIVLTRNALFDLIAETIRQYVMKILRGWGRHEEKEEILSLSWEAFYFCLEKYRNFDVPLVFFFFDFTRYFLLCHYGRQDHVFLPLEELQDILSIELTPDNILFSKLLEVYRFRDLLPPNYHTVFDDAFMSMHPAPRWRQKTLGMGGHPKPVYDGLKTAFKAVVRYIMGENYNL